MSEKKVYTNPAAAGQPFITTISSGCKTPLLQVKFCNLQNPYYYPNSPKVPRYSVTCAIDSVLHDEFLQSIWNIEKNENIPSMIKIETTGKGNEVVSTGNALMKFQTKDKIALFTVDLEGKESPLELEDELKAGERIIIEFDILRYTKKNTMSKEHGISFKPTKIYYHAGVK